MKVYHIDRGHKLSAGQILDLSRPNSDHSYQLQYIDALFDDGKVGMLGNIYTYPNYSNPEENRNYAQETIFELVRQRWFPEMPSRFQSFFSIVSLSDTRHWLSFFINESSDKPTIWEVEVEKGTTLDASWRDFRNTNTYFDAALSFYSATQYWSKAQYPQTPRLENLSCKLYRQKRHDEGFSDSTGESIF